MQALSKRLPIILLTLVLAGSFTGQAGATSVEPILITGEENSNPNCADLGYGDFEVKFDSSPPLPGVGSSETYTDAFGNSITVTRTSDSTFNWTSTIGIDAVIVKAKNANVYVYDPESFGDSGLVTAAGPSGSPQTISHISFCYDYELTVSKTANATYNREWEWSIQKEAVPTLLEMFTGQSKSVTWNITVNKTGYTDSGFQASGSVTVTNNTPLSAGIASIVDTIDGVGVVPLTLTDDGNGDDILSPGEVWIYSYSTSLTDSSSRTNTVTVIDSLGGESVATADIVFGAPVLINDSVTIIDDRTTQTWLLAASDNTVSFEELLDCDDAVETEIGGEIKYGVTNTATIDETKQSAEAFVEIKCYELTVSKTAEGSYVKTHDWNITKTADPIEHNLFNGQEGTSDYSIEVIYGGFVNSDYEVISSITVTNNTPINAQISSIVDIFN
ncbi:MAG: hypothetical protein JXR73_14860, partial [Candidatus Omnitrophica bacterium]|nr:hypothetical protein [Candidatus Omnitrophota bacterium]